MIQADREMFLYSTAGGSMFPLIRWKEYLIVKKIPAEALQPGDIIVFREDREHPVCHRIVRIENQDVKRWFYTRGDQNGDEDLPVSEQEIIGKVIAIKKKYDLLECPSPEWSFCSDPQDHVATCSLFYLKNLLKKIITFINPCRW